MDFSAIRPLPGLVPALVIKVELGPDELVGATPLGQRTNYPITGGRFAGQDPAGRPFAGNVLSGGADHFLLRADEVGVMDATYRLQTEDGVTINIHNRGLWVPDAAGRARLARGKEPEPHELYCRCTPAFEAPAGPYAWMNTQIFTGRVDYPAPARVLVSCYRLA